MVWKPTLPLKKTVKANYRQPWISCPRGVIDEWGRGAIDLQSRQIKDLLTLEKKNKKYEN